jgi:hypothetical protein
MVYPRSFKWVSTCRNNKRMSVSRAGELNNWFKMVMILLLPFGAQFEIVRQANLAGPRDGKSLGLRQILWEVEVFP